VKKITATLLALVVIAALTLSPAAAAKKSNLTLFLHGREEVGEFELPQTWIDSDWMPMDAKKPEGPEKSRFVTNYVRGPNPECSGNGLYPVWKGELSGTVKGNVKITLFTAATPAAQLALELFPDATGGCNSATSDDYVPPAAATVVDVPPGMDKVTATIKNVNFKVAASLTLQVRIAEQDTSPAQVRLFYDSEDSPASVKLSLIK